MGQYITMRPTQAVIGALVGTSMPGSTVVTVDAVPLNQGNKHPQRDVKANVYHGHKSSVNKPVHAGPVSFIDHGVGHGVGTKVKACVTPADCGAFLGMGSTTGRKCCPNGECKNDSETC